MKPHTGKVSLKMAGYYYGTELFCRNKADVSYVSKRNWSIATNQTKAWIDGPHIVICQRIFEGKMSSVIFWSYNSIYSVYEWLLHDFTDNYIAVVKLRECLWWKFKLQCS